MDITDVVFLSMTDYFAADARRIQHFTRVHAFARLMGHMEGLDEHTQRVLEIAALVHDIGIKPAEEKYGSCSGALQEKEGPAEAGKLLCPLGLPEEDIRRVCFLVGHHHTYDCMDGADYQMLVEADFLVNLYDAAAGPDAVRAACGRIFRTKSGRALCRRMFGLTAQD